MFLEGTTGRVRVRLSDGTERVTLRQLLELAHMDEGSGWPPGYDESPLVLKPGDPGFVLREDRNRE